MPRYFTHYWNNAIVEYAMDSEEEESPLEVTAGDGLTHSGVAVGDVVYIINVLKGDLFLIGRMRVGEILRGRSSAWRRLKHRAWAAEEHLVAARGSGTPQYFSRAVTAAALRNLSFLDPNGPVQPTFSAGERVEKRSVRGFREIDDATARLFDEILAQPISDDRDYDDEEYDETEDGDGLSDSDLKDIQEKYDNAELVERVADAAAAATARELEAQGYRFIGKTDSSSAGFNLRFLDGEDVAHVIVKGVVDSEPAFLITEREIATLESEHSAMLSVVSSALSRSPAVAIWTSEDFFDEFAVRPVLYAARRVD